MARMEICQNFQNNHRGSNSLQKRTEKRMQVYKFKTENLKKAEFCENGNVVKYSRNNTVDPIQYRRDLKK